jgi:peptide/nickel transport system permease protein
MIRFLAIRLLRALLTIVLVVSFAFIALRLAGDPAVIAMSPDAPPEALAAFRRAWGLDQPLIEQYLHYFVALAKGEFGQSLRSGRPALDLVLQRIPATLALTIPALLIKILVGLPAGALAALWRNSWVDRAVMALAVVGFTVPSFVLGLVLVWIFSVKLRWLPSGGAQSWYAAILPVLTLGLAGAGVLARFTRTALLEVLGQRHIRTAIAKGLPQRLIVLRHVLPNAAVPVITVIGFLAGSLLTGAVVVENVFSWPGIGRLLVLSVANRDLAVVQCILVLLAALMVAANVAVEMLQYALDPRLQRRRT